MVWPGSAWLQLSFSPFPVRHHGADHGRGCEWLRPSQNYYMYQWRPKWSTHHTVNRIEKGLGKKNWLMTFFRYTWLWKKWETGGKLCRQLPPTPYVRRGLNAFLKMTTTGTPTTVYRPRYIVVGDWEKCLSLDFPLTPHSSLMHRRNLYLTEGGESACACVGRRQSWWPTVTTASWPFAWCWTWSRCSRCQIMRKRDAPNCRVFG